MSTSTITVAGQPVTLVAMPGTPGLRSWEPKLHDAVALDVSPFTGQTQAQKWLGADLLSAMLNLPPLTQVQADAWMSFLMQLRGMANAFQMGDPLQPNIRGTGSSPFGPIPDNTVANGNAAGSETMGTQGWTPNAQGVLLQGDWFQVDYRLYRVLDDVNTDGAGKALIPIWPTLREVPTSDGIHGGWLNAAGEVAFTIVRSVGGNFFTSLWSNFALPPGYVLPPDAVITGIYPVLVASANFEASHQQIDYGTGLNLVGGGSWFPFQNPFGGVFGTPQANFSSTELYGNSIGTSLAALAGQQIRMFLEDSNDRPFPGASPLCTDTMTATGVGFAIYYTSATPHTDPQMPPPFTVPSGSGVAWALPFAATGTGVQAGGSGIFDPSGGEGVATPVIYNGALTLNGAKGLFRLASNDRGYSADVGRLTKSSFPIQEYR